MKKTIATISLLIAPLNTAQAAGALEKELACYNGLLGHSRGASTRLEDLRSVLLPSGNSSKKGFYLYSENSVLFCSFPARPHDSNSHYNYYYFQLENNGGTTYLTYSDSKTDSKKSGVGYGPEPAEALGGKYAKPRCRRELTDKTRRLLQDELSSRIQTAGSSYLSRPEHKDRHFGSENPVNRQKYVDALNGCSGIAAIQTTVDAAIRNFPGTTNPPTAPGNQIKDVAQ